MYTSRAVYEYISRQTNDPIIEWKTCRISGTEFPMYQSDLDFYAKISPTFDGIKFPIPAPTLCPEERQRRRLSFRNERKLYKRKCDATGETIISFVSPDKVYPVYKRQVRYSDVYDPMKYGRDFDFSKTFSENFQALLNVVPRYSIQQQDTMENSEYCNCASMCKNSYYLFDSDFNEDSYFSNVLRRSRNCVDCSFCDVCDGCFECIACRDCYQCKRSQNCIASNNCDFCYDCQKCSFCYGCSGLQNQSYYIYNIAYSKEEYFKKVSELTEYSQCGNIVPAMRCVQTEQCCGNNIINSKQIHCSYDINNVETAKYCDLLTNAKNCVDVSSLGEDLSDAYESVSIGLQASSIFFSSSIVNNAHHVYYSYICYPNVSYCFGCVGMKNGSYCILNKQYSKEDYEKTVAKIIAHMVETGEWGEFFHPSLSPFGYNETVAMEYFPLSVQQISPNGVPSLSRGEQEHQRDFSKFGYKRSTYSSDPVIPAGAKVIDWKLGTEVTCDDATILQSIFLCEASGRPYRIIKQELDFYHKHSLSLPKKHPDVRYEKRMKLRPGRTLFLRNCDCCGEEMLSVYPNNDKEMQGGKEEQKVYCDKCYQKEIFS